MPHLLMVQANGDAPFGPNIMVSHEGGVGHMLCLVEFFCSQKIHNRRLPSFPVSFTE